MFDVDCGCKTLHFLYSAKLHPYSICSICPKKITLYVRWIAKTSILKPRFVSLANLQQPAFSIGLRIPLLRAFLLAVTTAEPLRHAALESPRRGRKNTGRDSTRTNVALSYKYETPSCFYLARPALKSSESVHSNVTDRRFVWSSSKCCLPSFTRLIHKIKPKDLGNIPSGKPRY